MNTRDAPAEQRGTGMNGELFLWLYPVVLGGPCFGLLRTGPLQKGPQQSTQSLIIQNSLDIAWLQPSKTSAGLRYIVKICDNMPG